MVVLVVRQDVVGVVDQGFAGQVIVKASSGHATPHPHTPHHWRDLMHRVLLSFGFLAFATVPLSAQVTGVVPERGTPRSSPLDPLTWLAGCWELRVGDRIGHEQWMAPAGGQMLGMSRTMVGGVLRSWEYVRIQEIDGVVSYAAQPGGAPVTVFPGRSITDSMTVFEQPAHDFPQRIIYRRVGTDSLFARIEGDVNGQARAVDFPMRRVACSG